MVTGFVFCFNRGYYRDEACALGKYHAALQHSHIVRDEGGGTLMFHP